MRILRPITLLSLTGLVIITFGCNGPDIDKSKALIKAGKFTQAIESLRRQVAEEPENADAHFLLGVAYINTGELRAADEQFVKASQMNPDYGSRIGREYKKAGDDALKRDDTAKAFNFFQDAVRYHPKLKKDVARSAYDKGNDLSLAGKDVQALEFHQYALANDPLLGRNLGEWYAVKAQEAESISEQAEMRMLAEQFVSVYAEEHARSLKAKSRQEAEKNAVSARAKLEWALERRIDEYAWEKLAHKGAKALGDEEIIQWTVRYYETAGYEVKQLKLKNKDWVRIGRVANQSSLFFLSAKDFWYMKSSRPTPRNLGTATTRAKGIQFRGNAHMEISVRTENPPNEVFYWITPRS